MARFATLRRRPASPDRGRSRASRSPAYAFVEIAGQPAPVSFAIWFAGAIVAHDLVAFPLYSLLDLIAGGAASAA